MNYTVLVVEDECEQRRSLIENVDWSAAGFVVIGEAENGVEAIDLVESLEPDLILTDIKMSMISGLELAARVRELRPATQIVILSGYDSFEYARTAINYNIIRYLLKPISSVEMLNELFEIHRRMDEKLESSVEKQLNDTNALLRKLQVNEFLLPLMLGNNESKPGDGELFSKAENLGIIADSAERRFCVLITKFKNEEGISCIHPEHVDFINRIISEYMHSETFEVYGRAVTLVVVKGDRKLSNALELPLLEIVQTAKRMFKHYCTIGASREFSLLSNCSSAYLQAVTARRYTSDGTGEIRFIDDQERDGEYEIEYEEKIALNLEQLLKVGSAESL